MEESKTHFFLSFVCDESCLHNFLLLYKQIYETCKFEMRQKLFTWLFSVV